MRYASKRSYPKSYFIIMASISAFVVLYALFVEYGLNHKPCMLCIYERIPYMVIFSLAIVALLSNCVARVALELILISLATSFMLASYHFGMEQGIFQETAHCANQTAIATSQIDDIMNIINNTQAVSCKNVDYTIFGFSMAFWNILTSLLLLVYSIKIYAKKKNRYFN